MTDPIQHDLLGYLLDALEPHEREQVEAELESDPRRREQLGALQQGIRLLDDDQPCEPPPGLAARACAFVFQENAAVAECDFAPVHAVPVHAAPVHVGPVHVGLGHAAPLGGRALARSGSRESLTLPARSWRVVDIAVALAICVAFVALLFPLINASRVNAQVTACANKLRDIGLALTGYSEHHNGLFPPIAENGNLGAAGVYAPTLVDAGYLTNPHTVVCPGSALAEQPSFRIPTLDEIRDAKGDHLVELHRTMGGSYGYALGYRENGKYKPTRNLYRDAFALVADMPSDDLTTSLNHGRCGYNVLLEDGHVVYLRTCHLDGSRDEIFKNDLGLVAPGCHLNDAVIARSDVSP